MSLLPESFRLEWYWMLFMLPLPLLIYKWVRPRTTQHDVLQVPFFQTLGELTPSLVSRNTAHDYRLWWWAIWICVIVASARPQWLGDAIQLPTTGREMLLAVDISGSMQTQDMQQYGSVNSRLAVAKDVVGDFALRRQGDRLGLILFGSRPYMQMPLSFDLTTLNTLLQEAEIGLAGEKTAIGDAIGLAIKRLRDRPADSRVLIVLTDGQDTSSELSPLKAAQLAAEQQIKIYTIGIGAETMVLPGMFFNRQVNPSADLDEDTLKEIARLTGGRYFRARDKNELSSIYTFLDQLEAIAQEEEIFRPVRQLYVWPLTLAFLISIIFAITHFPIPHRARFH